MIYLTSRIQVRFKRDGGRVPELSGSARLLPEPAPFLPRHTTGDRGDFDRRYLVVVNFGSTAGHAAAMSVTLRATTRQRGPSGSRSAAKEHPPWS